MVRLLSMRSSQPSLYRYRIGIVLTLLVKSTGFAVSAPQQVLMPTAVSQPGRVVASANGRMVAYVLGDVLWAQHLGTNGSPRGVPIQVSAGMRRNSGYLREFEALSPDGSRLAFRTGHGGVRDQGELRVAAFDRAGGVSVKPLVTGSLASRLQTFVHFAAGGTAWSRDNRHVAFTAVDTANDQHLQLYVADAETGTVERWTDDSTWKFSVAWNPDGRRLAVSTGDSASRTATVLLLGSAGDAHEIVHVPGRWLTDLLWSPDGTRLIAAPDSGKPLIAHLVSAWSAQMEHQSLPQLRFVGFTPDGKSLVARRADGMSARLVLVELNSGKVSVLSAGDTLFTPIGVGGSLRNAVLVFTAESGAIPREICIAKLFIDGNRLLGAKVIARATGIPAGGMPFSYRVYRWESSKEETLEAKLYSPRKLGLSPPPLVVIPYGGYVNSFEDPEGFLEHGVLDLLRRGWVVAFPNTRCAATDDSCVGHYGDLQLEDTERMMEALGTAGLADPNRTAVIGHSHGGTLAYYYATHSTRFCAVVAMNGRADWEAQARYGDGYLVQQMGGMPDDVPAVYNRFSPLRNAASAGAPVLAVAGKLDTQILPINAPTIVSALHAANKRAELLEFPDEGHLIIKPENIQRLWDSVFAMLNESCGARRK